MYIQHSFLFGDQKFKLETGHATNQSVLNLEIQGAVISTAIVVSAEADPELFTPLIVDYCETADPSTHIVGFNQLDTSEHEIHVSTLIARSLSPLLPSGYKNQIQLSIQATVSDGSIDTVVPAILAASIALEVFGIPFCGPLVAARVGYINKTYVLNPNLEQRRESQLDLIVAGTNIGLAMVDAVIAELPEEVVLNGINFGHEKIQVVIDSIENFCNRAKKEPLWNVTKRNIILEKEIASLAELAIEEAHTFPLCERTELLQKITQKVLQELTGPEANYCEPDVRRTFIELERSIIRQRLIDFKSRIDGRNARQIQPFSINNQQVLPAKGVASFSGNASAFASVTVSHPRTEIDAPQQDRLTLHYTLPLLPSEEIERAERTEIAAECFIKNAIKSVMPLECDFDGVIHVTTKVTAEGAASEQAAICAVCIAMLNAGIPITSHVASVGMGVIILGGHFTILSDPSPAEEHLSDLNLSVAGTESGLTALQVDAKTRGITLPILHAAFSQARESRLIILDVMRDKNVGSLPSPPLHGSDPWMHQ